MLFCQLIASDVGAEDMPLEMHVGVDAYRVQAGDVLSISVWNEPELERDVLVLPDHTIAFPLVGVLPLQGKSVKEIAATLGSALTRYIPDANVHVAVKQVRGNKIFVIGKVARPGEFPLETPLTVLQALSMAGGTSTFAKPDAIKVIRHTDKGQQALHFDYSDIARGEALEQNIVLTNGDVVVVP
ncbi:MAG: sugar transporter [Oleiphilus sp.]|nr:MAG: sugar transporter [Oleiphilus sp.]